MFGFVLGEMWQGLRRNASMVISVILVTFVSLTFVGAALMLQFQIQSMKTYWYDRAQVAVDFCTDLSTSPDCSAGVATEEQIAAVEAELTGPALSPYINEYYFETQQEAYDRFVEQFKDDPMVSFVKPEQLNQTFWVNLVDPSDSEIIVQTVSGMSGVESVTDQRQFLDSIFAVLNGASLAAFTIALVMLVAAVLLVATTIRLSAFSRRRELRIMRLVGASNGFIQAPFILEGVFAGLVGSLLASGAVIGGAHWFVQGYLAPRMPGVQMVGVWPEAIITASVLIVLGVLLAAISSWVSIRRYLRV
ncbi:permease-like cell division protein FtsX [Gulosibacter molinativorax]|uniref:Cell division protein FtsX n=1 Tax=Gulosibacter molinativorax TaxID=256821 RepID=A0ABT7CCT2_9MICO|nr:permease-like cell division protein FtsX [Gulosibacter molinativorax]MDJ1372507.1 ABC transporter permease [Gulosibacter molinativorax]QUY61915.1 Cell division protein FtsX [Gulosibacter molinativorax]